MATITLTAGDLSGVFGAGAAGYLGGFGGSTSGGDLLDTFTDAALFENGSAINWACTGNAVASLTSLTHLRVDGVDYAVTVAPAFDGTYTNTGFAHRDFTVSSSYTVSLVTGGGPVDPNITSAATVENLVDTTLAHTIAADKTISSTAITGGADAAAFEINGTSTLRFASNAASSALGPLVVNIEITDTDGLTDTQTITVTVKAIIFKGAKVYSRAGATSTANSSLTDFANPLTGATGIAAAIGDTVVVFPAIGSASNRDMIINTGYAEQADHYSNGTTYDANIGLFTKTLTSADTTVTFGSSGSTSDAQAGVIMLFRGVDPTTPMDVAVVLDQGTGTGKPNPAAITPATTGAVGIFGGAQAAATAAALASSDLTAFTQRTQADTNDIAVGAGFIEWTSGAIDPAVFTGGSSNAANSWATVSAALRPSWVDAGTPSVTVNNSAHTQTPSSPTLAAKSSITANGAANVHVASSPSIAAKSSITPSNSFHINAASAPALAANSAVTPDAAAHLSVATSPTVSVPVPITPADSAHLNTVGEPSLAAKSSIVAASAYHVNAATQTTIATNNGVTVDDADHVTTAGQATVAANSSVPTDSAAHVNSVTSPTLAAQSSIFVDDSTHIVASGQATLASASSVSVDGSAHVVTSTQASVTPAGAVLVDSAAHDTTSSSPSLSAASSVSANGSAHTVTPSSPTLAANADTQPDFAAHVSTASEPSLSSGVVTAGPESAAHSVTSTSPAVAWAGTLAANDSGHSTGCASPTITAKASTAPDSSYHATAAESPSLAGYVAITPASTFHVQVAGSPTIRITLPPSTVREQRTGLASRDRPTSAIIARVAETSTNPRSATSAVSNRNANTVRSA